MQVITEIELLQRIDAFLECHEMAPTTFGRQATGEPQLIDSIRRGRSPSLKVVNRVVEFMERKNAEVAVRAKLDAPPPEEEDGAELPFAKAPVDQAGAFSPTSSSTSAPQSPPAASGSCPSCSVEPA